MVGRPTSINQIDLKKSHNTKNKFNRYNSSKSQSGKEMTHNQSQCVESMREEVQINQRKSIMDLQARLTSKNFNRRLKSEKKKLNAVRGSTGPVDNVHEVQHESSSSSSTRELVHHMHKKIFLSLPSSNACSRPRNLAMLEYYPTGLRTSLSNYNISCGNYFNFLSSSTPYQVINFELNQLKQFEFHNICNTNQWYDYVNNDSTLLHRSYTLREFMQNALIGPIRNALNVRQSGCLLAITLPLMLNMYDCLGYDLNKYRYNFNNNFNGQIKGPTLPLLNLKKAIVEKDNQNSNVTVTNTNSNSDSVTTSLRLYTSKRCSNLNNYNYFNRSYQSVAQTRFRHYIKGSIHNPSLRSKARRGLGWSGHKAMRYNQYNINNSLRLSQRLSGYGFFNNHNHSAALASLNLNINTNMVTSNNVNIKYLALNHTNRKIQVQCQKILRLKNNNRSMINFNLNDNTTVTNSSFNCNTNSLRHYQTYYSVYPSYCPHQGFRTYRLCLADDLSSYSLNSDANLTNTKQRCQKIECAHDLVNYIIPRSSLNFDWYSNKHIYVLISSNQHQLMMFLRQVVVQFFLNCTGAIDNMSNRNHQMIYYKNQKRGTAKTVTPEINMVNKFAIVKYNPNRNWKHLDADFDLVQYKLDYTNGNCNTISTESDSTYNLNDFRFENKNSCYTPFTLSTMAMIAISNYYASQTCFKSSYRMSMNMNLAMIMSAPMSISKYNNFINCYNLSTQGQTHNGIRLNLKQISDEKHYDSEIRSENATIEDIDDPIIEDVSEEESDSDLEAVQDNLYLVKHPLSLTNGLLDDWHAISDDDDELDCDADCEFVSEEDSLDESEDLEDSNDSSDTESEKAFNQACFLKIEDLDELTSIKSDESEEDNDDEETNEDFEEIEVLDIDDFEVLVKKSDDNDIESESESDAEWSTEDDINCEKKDSSSDYANEISDDDSEVFVEVLNEPTKDVNVRESDAEEFCVVPADAEWLLSNNIIGEPNLNEADDVKWDFVDESLDGW